MIVTHVHFNVAANERQTALTALLTATVTVRDMDGCQTFIPFIDPTDETRLGVMHEWEAEANFAAYIASDAFKTLGQALRPMMTAPPTTRRFDATLLDT
ncbi:MAG: antibiotic biosynthesis monooxygenase [Rhizobiales bacterium]|nr:antibiotic biosynthesis monooxygenase [Hyphomicrobiales bacterium]